MGRSNVKNGENTCSVGLGHSSVHRPPGHLRLFDNRPNRGSVNLKVKGNVKGADR